MKNLLLFGIFLTIVSCGKDKVESVTSSGSTQAVTSRSLALTFYSDPASFTAVCSGLPTEDFEEGPIPDGAAYGIPGPLNEFSNDVNSFLPGQILPGVSITSTGPFDNDSRLVYLGAGFNTNPSKLILSLGYEPYLLIDFTGEVQAASMQVISEINSDVAIEVIGASGLLGTTTVAGTQAGTFWGVRATEPIVQITVNSLTDEQEGIDDLSFGSCVVDADGDGVNDDVDAHPNSNPSTVVIIDGCNSRVPNVQVSGGSNRMDLILDCAASASKHKDFVKCVTDLANAWKAAGLITGAQKTAIINCARAANIP